MLGIDASSWQAGSTIIAAMKDSSFVIAKATEGTTYVDPRHAWLAPYARKHRWLLGHYHYAHPHQPADAQADYFINNARPRPGEVLALDLEANEATWAERVTFGLSFLARVKQRTGAPCWLYVNGSWATGLRSAATTAQWREVTGYPLWIADWNGTPGNGPAYGWPVITCHQYADHPLTDRDEFHGGTDTWHALAVPSPKHTTPAPVAPVKPEPSPVIPHVAVKIPGLAAPVSIDLQKE